MLPQNTRVGKFQKAPDLQYARYDMQTGLEILTGPQPRSGPETIFNNRDGGAPYFFTLQALEEYVDECAFALRDLDGDEQINGFEFSYCSSTPDPGTLDVVGLEVRFYQDTVFGAGPTNWGSGDEDVYSLNLPGDTSGTGRSCWSISIDLEGGFECTVPQETVPGGFTDFVGIGWRLTQGDADIFLDSNLQPAVPGYGSQDYIEFYDLSQPPGSEYLGAFFFGGAPKAQASFDFALYGDGILDTDVVNHDLPDVNDTLRLDVDSEMRAGSQVTFSVNNPIPGTFVLIVSTALDPAQTTVAPGVTGLLDFNSILTPPGPILMTSAPSASFTTPSLPGLPPTLYLQAFELSGMPISPSNVIAGSNALQVDN